MRSSRESPAQVRCSVRLVASVTGDSGREAYTAIARGVGVCGKAARTDLCGGRGVTRVPTATAKPVRLGGCSERRTKGARGGVRDLCNPDFFLFSRPMRTSVHGSLIVSDPLQCSRRTTATRSGPSALARGAAKVTGNGGKVQRVPGHAEKSFSPSSLRAG